ncbi:hypothetical protein TWF696_008049 [Orbilia brochopaga]|uniref:Uncharacterized protein n=1 Tax=Orbilia brochopaga TaxID=3140254 RepID=A0AAV9UM23_9PEZI
MSAPVLNPGPPMAVGGGPFPLFITFIDRGSQYAIRAAADTGLNLPLLNNVVDLPVGSRNIIWSIPPRGPGDTDAIWNMYFLTGDASIIRLLCRGGPAFEYNSNGASQLIVPKLQNQLPLVGGNGDTWLFLQTGDNAYRVQSKRTGLYWSIPKVRRVKGSGVVQLQPESSSFIQEFQFDVVQFDGENDNRGRGF